MRARSIEMLETLRKSAKKYNVEEILAFATDLRALREQEISSLLQPPRRAATKSAASKKPQDAFAKQLDAARKRAGMKAPDAAEVLFEILKRHAPADAQRVPAKTRKVFSALLDELRSKCADEKIEQEFAAAAAAFESQYSMRYDLT